MEMIPLYKNNNGCYIIQVAQCAVYFGNGKDINGFGIAAVQFLRFNPYIESVQPNEQGPDAIKEYIIEHWHGDSTLPPFTMEPYKRKNKHVV